ncbi:hypothetical protein KKG45_08260, partial [bacterium]|nr:hypothetical protein [bacterium]
MTIGTMLRSLPVILVLFASAGAQATDATDDALRVGEVSLVVIDIYGREELERSAGLLGVLRGAMNDIHTGTRHDIIRRELLFRPGDRLDTDLLRETERNLRDLGFLTNVSVVPTDTLPGGVVPLEVRVQETWSLTANVSYSRTSTEDRWSVVGSDNNFLGHGVQLEMGLGEDEDRAFRKLTFTNRRLLGSDIYLHASYVDLSDGHLESLVLARPFYADDTAWGFEAQAWDRRFEPRFYLSQAGPAGDGGEERLYTWLPVSEESFSISWSRRVSREGGARIWRLGLGVYVEDRNYSPTAEIELSDGRRVGRELIFEEACPAICRESGRSVRPIVVIETRGRTWAAEEFVLHYGPTEDLFMEPWWRLTAGPALAALGSDRERFVWDLLARDWSRAGPGFLYTELIGSGSLGSARNRFLSLDATAGWLVHTGRDDVSRLVVEAAHGSDLEGTDAFVLGLTRGLRSMEYDGMAGDRLLRWNAEHAHIIPGELIGFYRVGLAAFYAGGAAWWDGETPGLARTRHEAGFGLRFGPTRSAR